MTYIRGVVEIPKAAGKFRVGQQGTFDRLDAFGAVIGQVSGKILHLRGHKDWVYAFLETEEGFDTIRLA